jgi:galactarate dehydratase
MRPPRQRLHLRHAAAGCGMNLHVFTTGRGTPYGLAECTVIKVATRTDLARRWHDLMDVNAGTIADGTTIEEVGWEMFT